ncbi:MAG: hypothetical protein AB8B85_02755 [Paracoccaceae bacterium]
MPRVDPTEYEPETWAAIRLRYEGSVDTVAQIARTFGVSRDRINRQAKRQAWVRGGETDVDKLDKASRDRKRASAKARVEDAIEIASGQKLIDIAAHPELAPAAEMEMAVNTILGMLRQHKRHAGDLIVLGETLGRDLLAAIEYRETLQEIIEKESPGVDNANRRMAMNRAVSLPAQIEAFKKLSEAFAKVHNLDRAAMGMTPTDGKPDSPDDAATDLGKTPVEEMKARLQAARKRRGLPA